MSYQVSRANTLKCALGTCRRPLGGSWPGNSGRVKGSDKCSLSGLYGNHIISVAIRTPMVHSLAYGGEHFRRHIAAGLPGEVKNADDAAHSESTCRLRNRSSPFRQDWEILEKITVGARRRYRPRQRRRYRTEGPTGEHAHGFPSPRIIWPQPIRDSCARCN